jgi:hypothetical protein
MVFFAIGNCFALEAVPNGGIVERCNRRSTIEVNKGRS